MEGWVGVLFFYKYQLSRSYVRLQNIRTYYLRAGFIEPNNLEDIFQKQSPAEISNQGRVVRRMYIKRVYSSHMETSQKLCRNWSQQPSMSLRAGDSKTVLWLPCLTHTGFICFVSLCVLQMATLSVVCLMTKGYM